MLTDKEIAELEKEKLHYRGMFPPVTKGLFSDKIVGLVGEANREIGNLNSYARIIPNSDLLIGPLLLKEALASSKIEGTQASIKDILRTDADIAPVSSRSIDVQEVINYREATNLGMALLKTLPITTRLMSRVHQRLMSGDVRGAEKRIGEFRQGRNAIGIGGDINSIKYIPPSFQEVPDLMHNLEVYINDEKLAYDKLVRCAFMHYEFEAIHPFADGNGRVGRVLITLFLLKEGILKHPLIYPSAYFLHYKEQYDQCLLNITLKEDWSGWIEFFLTGIIEQAKKSQQLIESIDGLYQDSDEKSRNNSQSVHAHKLVELVFKRPIIRATEVSKMLGVEHQTAISLLRRFTELDILSTSKNVKKNIPFSNHKLIDLLEKS